MRELLDQFLAAARADPTAAATGAAAVALLGRSPRDRALAAAALTMHVRGGAVRSLLGRLGFQAREAPACLSLLGRLLETELRPGPAELEALLAAAPGLVSFDQLARHLELGALLHGLPDELRQRLAGVPGAPALAAALERLVDVPPVLITADHWGQEVTAWLDALDTTTALAWAALLAHCAGLESRAHPSARWSRQAATLVTAVGEAAFSARLVAWLGEVRLGPSTVRTWGPKLEQGPSDHNEDVLKGLLWAAGGLRDPGLAEAVARFGARCFQRLPTFGPASTKLGNACVEALGAMPGNVGVGHLAALASTVKYASGQRAVGRALDEAADATGVRREDLEELAAPTFGLDASGVARATVGAFTWELTLGEAGPVARWVSAAGRSQVAVPKAVRTSHADEVKALKQRARDVDAALKGHRQRMERLWLTDRRLTLRALRERFLAHPVAGQVARGLVWRVEEGGRRHELLWHEGRLGQVALPDEAEARLWHVLDAGSPEQLQVWRDHLEGLALTQPFPQVWREVYRPLDAEHTADDRFAGQLVHQQALLGLCRQRGWRAAVQGRWDAGLGGPTLALPRWNLTATLDTEGVEHAADQGFYGYLELRAVSFVRTDEGQLLPMGKVPPLVFSEVLRDVDLFVGGSTVANQVDFLERGLARSARERWQALAWGALGPIALTRGRVLSRALPRTTLRDRAHVEDRWLTVQGPRQVYRVHLGSAQVCLAGEEGRPLPVTVDPRAREAAGRVLLPFEQDSLLATILGKAFALAEADFAADEPG